MTENNFPITDTYKLEVNIDLNSSLLRDAFGKAMDGKTLSNDGFKDLVASLTGRDGISVNAEGERSFYSVIGQEIDVGSENIATMMAVDADNLPPNIPAEVTPELLQHLFALHEAEHVTQHKYEIDQKSGYIDNSTIEYTFMDTQGDENPASADSMKETDADLAVVSHLNNMGLPHVGQFWLDVRIGASFNHKFSESEFISYDHDAASLIKYFRETGDVIDPEEFIEQKDELMAKIQPVIMGVDRQTLANVLSEYPQVIRDRDTREEFLRIAYDSGDYNLKSDVRPQTIMHTVSGLLERGELDGLQKWEAENYIEAMKRVGYEPDAPKISERSYEEQIREILEGKMGLSPAGQTAEPSPVPEDEATDLTQQKGM